MRGLRLVLAAVLLLLAAGCDGSGSGGDNDGSQDGAASFKQSFEGAKAYPLIVSSEVVKGKNRLLVALFDQNDAPTGSPKTDMEIAFYDLAESPEDPVFSTPMRYVPIIPGERGVFAGYPSFPSAGKWGAEVSIRGEGLDDTLRLQLEVNEKSSTPAVGAPAPPSDTPTLADVESIKKISTDPDPDPRFYRVSVADALRRDEPFVFVLATPKFCTSQVCGPTLDVVKKVSRDYPKITFIHSEIYRGLDPSKPIVDAVEEWGLPSEPWVFVVDPRGRIVSKYEGSVSTAELRRDLDEL